MISIKTDTEIEIMRQGGRITARTLKIILEKIKPGVSKLDLEEIANQEILKSGAQPSFKMVPGYNWATCITVNEEVVHGIPNEYCLASGDVVGVDLGAFWKGFHTDASWSIVVEGERYPNKEDFLQAGKTALAKAIEQAKAGNRIGDISLAIQSTIEAAGYSVVQALVGHGVGRKLHEEPEVPGLVLSKGPKLEKGMVLAIEVIYAYGRSDVIRKKDLLNKTSVGDNDNWTILTKDKSLAGLFEHTVAITDQGPIVLTALD